MKAVFLDRDGTITEDPGFSNYGKLNILDGAIDAVKGLNKDFLIIVVTNQPVVARGLMSEEDVIAANDNMKALFAESGARIDAVYYCPHHPEQHHDVPEHAKKYRIVCSCRKPDIGMLKQAAKDFDIDLSASFIVGDSTMDILAGRNAGCKTILVKTGYGGSDKKHNVTADFECANLADAAEIIEKIRKVKVVILAGGKGERLMPLTRDIPKPMVEIAGKPAVQHHMELVKKHGIRDVVMCTSHMADKIKNYFGSEWNGLKIIYPEEPQPLGSGGAIKNAAPFLRGCGSFVVLNGDVMTNIDIGKLLNFHIKNGGLATMVVRYTDHPKDSDVVELENNRIVRYIGRGQEEKNVGNTGLMVLSEDILDMIPDGFCNIEKDVVFRLIGAEDIFGYLSEAYIKDFGTPERLDSVRKRMEELS